MVHLVGEPNLLEIILALRPASRFSGSLDRRQQQCHKDANDGDHDEQFDERKPTPSPTAPSL
jgi:hypothetical protein